MREEGQPQANCAFLPYLEDSLSQSSMHPATCQPPTGEGEEGGGGGGGREGEGEGGRGGEGEGGRERRRGHMILHPA